jgi:DNA-binding response OmpR family regulator
VTSHTVLVVSPDPDYLDEVGDALSELNALGVLAEGVEGASNAIADGFTPELVLVDPLLVGHARGEEILILLRRIPRLSTVPVLALSSPPPPGARERWRLRRVDREALITALHILDRDEPFAPA